MADQELVDDVEDSVAKKAKNVPKLSIPSKEPVLGVQKIFNDENSDVTFVESNDSSSKNKLSAHRMVLSVTSPFFYKMFQGDWKEKDQDTIPVPGGFQWDVFEAVISFLYGKDVRIEEGFLPELIRAADYLEVDSLKMAVDEGFTHWELENAAIAINVCCQGIDLIGGKEYIASHIQEILVQELDIGCLPMETIVFISQSEKIKVSEVTLHSFLTQWTNTHEQSLPFTQVQDIFSNIRYGTIPEQELKNLAHNKYYHNWYFGLALKQCSSFDLSEVHMNPKQYCSRDLQLPFPGPAVFVQDSYKWIIYAGHVNANLNAELHSSITSLRVKVLSIADESQCQEIKMADYIDNQSQFGSYNIRVMEIGATNSFRTCSLTLNKTSIEIIFKADKEWPKMSSSGPKTFPFEGPLPWLIAIANCKKIYTNE